MANSIDVGIEMVVPDMIAARDKFLYVSYMSVGIIHSIEIIKYRRMA